MEQQNLSPEELLELAKAEGIDLTDEQLEQISGGAMLWNHSKTCPKCSSHHVYNYTNQWFCRDCRYTWTDSPL